MQLKFIILLVIIPVESNQFKSTGKLKKDRGLLEKDLRDTEFPCPEKRREIISKVVLSPSRL